MRARSIPLPVGFAELDESSDSQVSRARIFRMQIQFALSQTNTSSRGLLALFITAKSAIHMNQKTRRLVIIRSNFGSAFEKLCCTLVLPSCESESCQKVVRFK